MIRFQRDHAPMGSTSSAPLLRAAVGQRRNRNDGASIRRANPRSLNVVGTEGVVAGRQVLQVDVGPVVGRQQVEAVILDQLLGRTVGKKHV